MIQDLGRLIKLSRQMTAHPLSEGDRATCMIRVNETLPFFQKVLSDHQFDTLLEVGPGLGIDAEWWRSQGKRVSVIDVAPSEPLLKSAEIYGYEVREGDMHDVPYPDEAFDCVLSKHSLEHSMLPMVAIEETRRVLKPGGLFMLVVPPGHPRQAQGHFVPGWNEPQACYLLAVCGFKVLYSTTAGWSVMVLGQKTETAYNGDCYPAFADRWIPAEE